MVDVEKSDDTRAEQIGLNFKKGISSWTILLHLLYKSFTTQLEYAFEYALHHSAVHSIYFDLFKRLEPNVVAHGLL